MVIYSTNINKMNNMFNDASNTVEFQSIFLSLMPKGRMSFLTYAAEIFSLVTIHCANLNLTPSKITTISETRAFFHWSKLFKLECTGSY